MRFGTVAAIGLFAVLATCEPTASASRATRRAAPAAVPAGGIGTLTADSAQLNGLVYHPAGDGTTADTIELSSTSADFTNLSLQSPCVLAGPPGAQGLATTLLASSSRAAQGITLWATSVTGTSGGQAVTWTPANPPAQTDLGDVSFADLTVELVTASVRTLAAPGGARQYSWFC